MFKKKYLFFILLFVTTGAFGQIRLPALISDGMVLQRGEKLNIWGWASVGEKIYVEFNNQEASTVTDGDGKWMINLPPMKAGGPYRMVIKGSNEVIIDDILIGDVWLCSGQSNMAFKMDRVKSDYTGEIAESANSEIRQFLVKPSWSFLHQEDVVSDGWIEANPSTVLDYTAVGYFFAKKLYDKVGVPIGIINSSYSATVAEAWVSEEGLREFPAFATEAKFYKDSNKVRQALEANEKLKVDWNNLQKEKDEGSSGGWKHLSFDNQSWDSVAVPGYWSKPEIKNKSGVVWMVKDIYIPADLTNQDMELYFGAIDDRDSTFFNGVHVGNSYMRGRERKYSVPRSLIKNGKNRIAVRIINPDGPGGFYPDKVNELRAAEGVIDLNGYWKYRIGATLPTLKSKSIIKFNIKPTAVYNSMVAPLTNYTVKGVAWYQGEGNAGRAYQYRTLFKALINDWRQQWKQKELPFMYVQLANFGKRADNPVESSWAELREAQTMALALPGTGMAVIHDVGEASDIHPRNKKTVGKRLASVALDKVYNKNVLSSGPTYKSLQIDGDKAILQFETTESPLTIGKRGERLESFSIAGADRKFYWAQALIQGNTVIVWSDKVPNPVAVRYAWANNPWKANLYNAEGLPATSFRTDDWPGKTVKRSISKTPP